MLWAAKQQLQLQEWSPLRIIYVMISQTMVLKYQTSNCVQNTTVLMRNSLKVLLDQSNVGAASPLTEKGSGAQRAMTEVAGACKRPPSYVCAMEIASSRPLLGRLCFAVSFSSALELSSCSSILRRWDTNVLTDVHRWNEKSFLPGVLGSAYPFQITITTIGTFRISLHNFSFWAIIMRNNFSSDFTTILGPRGVAFFIQ